MDLIQCVSITLKRCYGHKPKVEQNRPQVGHWPLALNDTYNQRGYRSTTAKVYNWVCKLLVKFKIRERTPSQKQ